MALTSAAPVFAQITHVDPEIVATIAKTARASLTKAVDRDGKPLPPETPAELAHPIVPADLDGQTVDRGFVAGQLALCQVEWEDSYFLPYMRTLRTSGFYSQKQLAYVGLLHGLAMAIAKQVAGSRPDCSDGAIRQLQAALTQPVVTP